VESSIEVIANGREAAADSTNPPIAGATAPVPAARSRKKLSYHPLCRACTHPDSMAITAELANGAPAAQVARRFNLGRVSMARHRRNHVSEEVMRAARRRKLVGDSKQRLEEIKEDESTNLLARLTIVRGKINAALAKAEEIADLRAVALLSAQIHVNAQLIAKLLGELPSGGVNVTVGVDNRSVQVAGSDLLKLRDVIERALEPWPPARTALLSALASASRPVPA
jgi:hypothetical protein